MTEVETWSRLAKAEKAKNALVKNGFDAVVVKTAEEAAALLMAHVHEGTTMGFGGSMTIKSLGIQEKAAQAGAKILDHNRPGITPEEKMDTLRAQLSCDLFVCSVNALTMKGELLNIDGNGNRVAAMTFGPKKNVVVVGANKIVADEAEGWRRLETWASPMNNKRLSKENPCVKTGVCMNCDSPTRICRVYQVLRRKPMLSDFTVIIVAQDLGY
ncbi:MAG TPA: lactate utilization protein [Rectinemataceae bacterium]